ncbi:MAG TPA: spermidine/putrescine ABC transporter substrate-binding protein PotF, partial [Pseudomonas sp.]|nr:spermidine/putrescine ABC transporter substrate-binding protein PotF [Pseudomonas sp.]
SWADYVAPQTLQRFEKETGYKVRYDTFDTTEVLETKLLTGGSGYDVVV